MRVYWCAEKNSFAAITEFQFILKGFSQSVYALSEHTAILIMLLDIKFKFITYDKSPFIGFQRTWGVKLKYPSFDSGDYRSNFIIHSGSLLNEQDILAARGNPCCPNHTVSISK